MISRKNAAIALDDEQQYIYVFGDDIPPPGPCSACASRGKMYQDNSADEEEDEDEEIHEHFARFDCVWQKEILNGQWRELPIIGAEVNYPEYESSSIEWPKNSGKYYTEPRRNVKEVCGINANCHSPAKFFSFRGMLDDSGEKNHIFKFFLCILAPDGAAFGQKELPLIRLDDKEANEVTAKAFREFGKESFGNFIDGSPFCCTTIAENEAGLLRLQTHFIFISPNFDGDGFTIFKLSEPVMKNSNGLEMNIDNANMVQLSKNPELREEVEKLFSQMIASFCFSNYIGFLRLKEYDNTLIHLPLDKILLFDVEKEEYSMRALKPDKSAGFPRGFVQARYNSSCNTTVIPQQQSVKAGANFLSNYELHMPGGIYWNSEQEKEEISDEYWILDLTAFTWRFVGHLAKLKLHLYSTAYSWKLHPHPPLIDYNTWHCWWQHKTIYGAFPEELSNELETITLPSPSHA